MTPPHRRHTSQQYRAAFNARKEAIRRLTFVALAIRSRPWGVTGRWCVILRMKSLLRGLFQGVGPEGEHRRQLDPMRPHGRAEEDVGAAIISASMNDEARLVTGHALYVDIRQHLLGLPRAGFNPST